MILNLYLNLALVQIKVCVKSALGDTGKLFNIYTDCNVLDFAGNKGPVKSFGRFLLVSWNFQLIAIKIIKSDLSQRKEAAPSLADL